MQRIHVVAGVIRDEAGNILLAQRLRQAHQGGLWEFAGGKVEPGETAFQALQRELKEELDLNVHQASPLIQIDHHYPSKHIFLDVWRVERWDGQERGCDGQALRWVKPEELSDYPFPAANYPILKALALPAHYLITPQPGADFLLELERTLASGQIQLMQLRAPAYSDLELAHCAEQALKICANYQVNLLLNASPQLCKSVGAAGVHLNSQRLQNVTAAELEGVGLIGASCHNPEELSRAAKLRADFALLSPVQVSSSHPNTAALGWKQFAAWTLPARLPVYALGGMRQEDLSIAQQQGAQGIAAIRGLWLGGESLG